ncbi:hypothetical protein [Paenibacillus sp. OV219]|uniref:hypothetical protein n=1 Tax=Paenibacillus sp. OV219 TaxID=1884377 RepID=UPI0008C31B5F|nr:hypothetical protein [Paenibacillus sp. OV219]SEM81757.1 hypothetical protein SAMN05518847_101880 [Paenibacillus sp. OV219]
MKDSKLLIRLTLADNHQVNFGTADKPDYKTDGDEVSCDKKAAAALVTDGLAVYINQSENKEENTDGK